MKFTLPMSLAAAMVGQERKDMGHIVFTYDDDGCFAKGNPVAFEAGRSCLTRTEGVVIYHNEDTDCG
jgi:hypothetical protein